MKYRRGRTLTIITDCHSSGQWVSECAKFLDEQGVKPCGHSAREKGILLKVYASCQPGQESAELLYTTRAMELGYRSLLYLHQTKQLSDQQTTHSVDFTAVRCGEKKCSIAPSTTWSTAREVIAHRKRTVHGTDNLGRPTWHFLLLEDDTKNIKSFKENYQKTDLVIETYGTVLRSGFGEPSPEEQEWFKNYEGNLAKQE